MARVRFGLEADLRQRSNDCLKPECRRNDAFGPKRTHT